MTVVNSYVNYCFDRYQKGFLKDAQVVSQLLNTKVPKECLVALLERISKLPHWQENTKLKNLYKFTKTSLKNNFAGAKVETAIASSPLIAKQNVIDQGLGKLPPELWGLVGNRLHNVLHLFRLASTCKEAYFLRDEMMARSSKLLSRYLNELLEKKDEKSIMRFLVNCSQGSYADTPLALVIHTTWPRQIICLHEIQKKFPNIQSLTIGKPDIDDTDFELLLESLPNVKVLDLSGCAAITPGALTRLKYPSTLEELYITNTALDNLGLQALCKNLPKLKVLDIKNCPAITVDATICAQLPASIQCYEFDAHGNPPRLEHLKQLLESHPKNAILLSLSALMQDFIRFDLSELKVQIEEALTVYPQYAFLSLALGCILLGEAVRIYRHDWHKFDETLAHVERHACAMLRTLKDYNDLSFLLMTVLVLRQKYPEALAFVNEQLKKSPDCVGMLAFKGCLYTKQGVGITRNFKEAEALLLQSNANARVEHALNFLILALIYIEGGDGVAPNPEEAKRCVAKALSLDNDVFTDPMGRSANMIMNFAKLGKLILDDPELKVTRGNAVKELFKDLLMQAPNNKELKLFVLSCTL